MSRHEPMGISYGAWLGMVGMAIVGVASAGFAVVAAFGAAYDGSSTLVVFAVFAGLTVIPAAILWFIGNRYVRAGAVGLAVAFLSASLYVLWSPWATMNEGEVERAKAEALASGNPAFYLGEEVDGYPLNDYYLGSDQANFFYGECHEDPDLAGERMRAHPHAYGTSRSTPRGRTSRSAGMRSPGACARPPWRESPRRTSAIVMLGVNEVVLFTGKSQVRIVVEAEPSVEEQLQLAGEVRQVGDTEAATRFPLQDGTSSPTSMTTVNPCPEGATFRRLDD